MNLRKRRHRAHVYYVFNL